MANEKDKTLRFEVGGRYNCTTNTGEILTFECYKRSPNFVRLRDVAYGKLVRAGVYATSDGVEYCYPLGRYTSKPMLFSNNKVNETNKK